jgi:hypothetical protein
MAPHEIVIRLGRVFDVLIDDEFKKPPRLWIGEEDRFQKVTEIRIPFADQASADAALAEVSLSVRAVHDTGGEDYRPVAAGEVVKAKAEIEGTVRTLSTPGSFTEVETRVLPDGVLQVTSYYTAVKVNDPLPRVTGWHCYRREAALNGEPVLDPLRAQELYDEASITPPGPIDWSSHAGD